MDEDSIIIHARLQGTADKGGSGYSGGDVGQVETEAAEM